MAIIAFPGDGTGTELPVAIQEVVPSPGSNVLSQTDVEVDLAVGYTAEIDINGVEIPEDQLFRVDALNKLSYQPGAGKVVPRLLPDQNCVRVFYWLIATGDQDRQSYTWCFDAS